MLAVEKSYSKKKNYTRRFIIYTYLLFWTMVSTLAVILLNTGQKPWMFEWGSAVCSWSPTLVVLLMFKKLFPNMTIKEFYKKAFSEKINMPLLLTVTLVQTAILAASTSIVALRYNVSPFSLWNFTASALITGVLYTAIQGATGEETGWRGFLQPALVNKYDLVKGSIMVGLVWSFWHIPLWAATGLTGINLLAYAITFIIGNICLAVIIGVSYNRCKNLFVPIWIHFWFNFSSRFYSGDAMYIRYWLVLFYIIAAIGFIFWHKGISKSSKA